MGGDRINLSRALSLLHREGADWDPKASEWLQEVQFIIFNGEEQEVETWSWALWFIRRLSRVGGGGRSKSISLSTPLVCSRSCSDHTSRGVRGSSSTPPKYTCTSFEPLLGNNIRICLSNYKRLGERKKERGEKKIILLIYNLLLMSAIIYVNTCSLISYCWCVGGAVAS